ncbi:MAG: ATP-binding protein [Armatimonadota bacterium]|nr:ATP-binding protein [Armatimonadota bacterium]
MKLSGPDDCVDSVELKIPCKPEYVRTVRSVVKELAEELALPVESVDAVQIAVSEAVANIIRHAYGPGKSPQPVFLRCCRGPGRLTIEIIDRGIGFSVPKTDQPPDLSREGGLGIVLIRALMDRVDYWSRPNVGTRIRMMKMAPNAPPAATAAKPSRRKSAGQAASPLAS